MYFENLGFRDMYCLELSYQFEGREDESDDAATELRLFLKYILRGLEIEHYNKGLNSVLLYRYYLELVLLAVASTSYRRHACSRHITASKVKLFYRHMHQSYTQTKEGANSFSLLKKQESFATILSVFNL